MRRTKHWSELTLPERFWAIDPKTKVLVERYKTGARIHYPQTQPTPEPDGCPNRESEAQSSKSRMNCSFNLGNAETNWLAMLTLTYRSNPKSYEEVCDHRKKFLGRLRKRWPSPHFAWFLEFTEKGAAHYHLFFGSGGALGKELANAPRETITRKGKPVELIRGDCEKWFVRWWRDLTGDSSDEWERFQNGGILEAVRFPDAAGRYAAKEAGKRVQKNAPWPVKSWWYLSPNCRPEVRKSELISLRDLHRNGLDRAIARVWEGERVLKLDENSG